MPWNQYDYPVSMKNLPVDIRNKAIEIANALLAKGNMEEGIIIATAIKHAKEWALKRSDNAGAIESFWQDEFQ
jgi:uncharacterized protein YdaT